MEDMGVAEQGFVVRMVEQFSCEVEQGLTVVCIVMEHLGKSLGEYLRSIEATGSGNQGENCSMEYSESEIDTTSCADK